MLLIVSWKSLRERCLALSSTAGSAHEGDAGVVQESASAVLFFSPEMNSHLSRIAVKYCKYRTSLADSRGIAFAAVLMSAL